MRKLMDRPACLDFIADQFLALAPSQLPGVEPIAHQEIIIRLGGLFYDLVRDNPSIVYVNHASCPAEFYRNRRKTLPF
jgi:hypothetical protein